MDKGCGVKDASAIREIFAMIRAHPASRTLERRLDRKDSSAKYVCRLRNREGWAL